MFILREKKIIFKKLFLGSLLVLISLISVFGVINIIQKHANAAEVYVAGDGNWASYGDYGNGAENARTDQFKVKGSVNAYCANPSKRGPSSGYYSSSALPTTTSYYSSIRLLIYLSTVGYSSYSDTVIMESLFGSDKSNSTMRYVLTHAAIGAMYANDYNNLSTLGLERVNTMISSLASYINYNGPAFIESQNYSIYIVAGQSAEYQDLLWIEPNPTPPSTPGKAMATKMSSGEILSFSGIQFSIYENSSCSGDPSDTQTIGTNESSVIFSNLTLGGTYYIKETGTNSNYNLSDSRCQRVTATETGTGDGKVTFVNQPVDQSTPGVVTAIKQSSSSYSPSFSGIEFSVYNNSTCSGSPITTKTISGSSDSVTFYSGLEAGEVYSIKETRTNSNYYLTDTSCQSVRANTDGTGYAAATFTNNPIMPGKVKAVKQSSSITDTPSFAGIKFSIYSSSSCTGTPIATKSISGSSSSVIFDADLEVGTVYYIKEVETNSNYYLTDTSCQSVTATTNGTESTATATFTNNPIVPGKVTATKQSNSNDYRPSFAGIKFSVYNTSSCSGTPIATKTLSGTASSVVFDTNLEKNKTYYIKESIGTNTNYYETDTSCHEVTATTNGTESTATAIFKNNPIGKIKVNKCDSEINSNCSNSSIKAQGDGNFNGIKFTLYNNSQCTQVTTSEGLTNPQTLSGSNTSITFERLIAGQTYYVKESITDNIFYNESDSNCKAVTATTSSSSDVNFNNTIKKTSLKVIKHDSETNSCTTVGNNSFNGTSFKLVNKSANSIYYNNNIIAPNGVVDTKTLSSGRCDVTFEGLPYGTYQISETPSSGYNGADAKTVTLSSSTATEVTFINTAKKGKVIVNKIDADTESCTPYNANFTLNGTSFTLTNKTGGLVYYDGRVIQNGDPITTKTLSNGNCQVTFNNLPYGNYEITEQPSFGYIPITSSPQSVTISGTTETITKTFKNRFIARSLGTTASDDEDGDKFVEANENAKIIDTISYCVTPGKDFVIKGALMDKSTGEKLLINGNPVENSINLNSTTECGEVEMEFEFDASELGGKDLVVFEDLYYENTLILEHHDLEDTDQTITVLFLKTLATNRATGKKILPLNESVEIVDYVDYCLKPDLEYTLKGVIMNRNTGEKLLINGAPIEDELTFTPTDCCGQVEMTFTLNTADLAGAELVIFENLYYEDQLILEHNDIYNVDQTVSVENPAPVPAPAPTPNTGQFNEDNNNTNESFGIILVACSAFTVGISGYIIYRKISKVTFSRK